MVHVKLKPASQSQDSRTVLPSQKRTHHFRLLLEIRTVHGYTPTSGRLSVTEGCFRIAGQGMCTCVGTHSAHKSTCVGTHSAHKSTCVGTHSAYKSTCVGTHSAHKSTCVGTHSAHMCTCVGTHSAYKSWTEGSLLSARRARHVHIQG